MKNILNIIQHDLKKITGSVVAIVTIIGLCLVPCSYAWFNILSNWAPYEPEATGRIRVAVASLDEGASAAGLTINVGEKIVEGLEANDDIGWVFLDSDEEAIKGVYKGDYYAALVVPEDFTSRVLSFMSGDLTNPELKYYENEKKNAIAPKITGKAKTAVQEQVNATFVETLASYVSDAASIMEANGLDPSALLKDLSEKTDALGRDIDSCIALSESAAGLTEAAGGLMDASGSMIDSTQNVLAQNDSILNDIEGKVQTKKTEATEARDKASELADKAKESMASLDQRVQDVLRNFSEYADFVQDKNTAMAEVEAMQQQASDLAGELDAAGYTELASALTQLSDTLGSIDGRLDALDAQAAEEKVAEDMNALADDIQKAHGILDDVTAQIKADIDAKLADALAKTRKSVAAYRSSLTGAENRLGDLSSLMNRYGNALGSLESSVDKTTANLEALKRGSGALSDLLYSTSQNELLQELSGMLANDETAVAEYLANPVKMEKEVLWPIENYGSAMAPFYTVLAQWVGALLTAVLIKVKIRKRDDLSDLKLHEWYFGRYGLYLAVGLAQALVVALGDLLYVHIQCMAPLRFVLAACVNGMVFMMINYALVFALDNIGLGAGVIILVLQVAGSGGTYPVEVLPKVFQVLYPAMPFRYAMDAMRECIGGMYDGTYWKCIGILLLFMAGAILFGMAFYRPAKKLNEMIAASKAKSEIML